MNCGKFRFSIRQLLGMNLYVIAKCMLQETY